MSKDKKKAIVLLSGGLDSTTVLALVKKDDFDIYAISFDYGQRHEVELDACRQVANQFNVKEHKIIKLDMRAIGGSALTDDIEVPKSESVEDIPDEIPVTYVPARNTVFLSYALGWADVIECGDIFIGVNALDYSGYPDCRPEFVAAFEVLANLATKQAVEGTQKIKIHSPLIDKSKSEIIQIGVGLGVDYGITTSCYDPDEFGRPCGKCDSCLLRAKGFQEAGISDPRLSWRNSYE